MTSVAPAAGPAVALTADAMPRTSPADDGGSADRQRVRSGREMYDPVSLTPAWKIKAREERRERRLREIEHEIDSLVFEPQAIDFAASSTIGQAIRRTVVITNTSDHEVAYDLVVHQLAPALPASASASASASDPTATATTSNDSLARMAAPTTLVDARRKVARRPPAPDAPPALVIDIPAGTLAARTSRTLTLTFTPSLFASHEFAIANRRAISIPPSILSALPAHSSSSSSSSSTSAAAERTPLPWSSRIPTLRVTGSATLPSLAVTTAQLAPPHVFGDHADAHAVWSRFSLDALNRHLASPLTALERRINANQGVERVLTRGELFEQLTSVDFRFPPRPFDMRRSSSLVLRVTNTSRVATAFSFAYPTSLSFEPPRWAALADASPAMRYHQSLIHANLFSIVPMSAELLPDESIVVTVTYHHTSVGEHALPMVLSIKDGKSMGVRLHGRTVDALPARFDLSGLPHATLDQFYDAGLVRTAGEGGSAASESAVTRNGIDCVVAPEDTHVHELSAVPVHLTMAQAPWQHVWLCNPTDVPLAYRLTPHGAEQPDVFAWKSSEARGVLAARQTRLVRVRFRPVSATSYAQPLIVESGDASGAADGSNADADDALVYTSRQCIIVHGVGIHPTAELHHPPQSSLPPYALLDPPSALATLSSTTLDVGALPYHAVTTRVLMLRSVWSQPVYFRWSHRMSAGVSLPAVRAAPEFRSAPRATDREETVTATFSPRRGVLRPGETVLIHVHVHAGHQAVYLDHTASCALSLMPYHGGRDESVGDEDDESLYDDAGGFSSGDGVGANEEDGGGDGDDADEGNGDEDADVDDDDDDNPIVIASSFGRFPANSSATIARMNYDVPGAAPRPPRRSALRAPHESVVERRRQGEPLPSRYRSEMPLDAMGLTQHAESYARAQAGSGGGRVMRASSLSGGGKLAPLSSSSAASPRLHRLQVEQEAKMHDSMQSSVSQLLDQHNDLVRNGVSISEWKQMLQKRATFAAVGGNASAGAAAAGATAADVVAQRLFVRVVGRSAHRAWIELEERERRRRAGEACTERDLIAHMQRFRLCVPSVVSTGDAATAAASTRAQTMAAVSDALHAVLYECVNAAEVRAELEALAGEPVMTYADVVNAMNAKASTKVAEASALSASSASSASSSSPSASLVACHTALSAALSTSMQHIAQGTFDVRIAPKLIVMPIPASASTASAVVPASASVVPATAAPGPGPRR